MSVRQAKLSEAGLVLGLWKELANDPDCMDAPTPVTEGNTKTMSEFITKLIHEDSRQVLVAEDDDGELVGFLMFQRVVRSPIETHRKWANVSDLYVRPSHRERGIGRRLLEMCIIDLRASGTTHVRVRVWSKNENAIRLYRAVGFDDYTLTLEAGLSKAQ